MTPIDAIGPAGRDIEFQRPRPINSLSIRISPERIERANQIFDSIRADEEVKNREREDDIYHHGVAQIAFTGGHAESEAYNEGGRIMRDLKTVARFSENWKNTTFISEKDFSEIGSGKVTLYITYK